MSFFSLSEDEAEVLRAVEFVELCLVLRWTEPGDLGFGQHVVRRGRLFSSLQKNTSKLRTSSGFLAFF